MTIDERLEALTQSLELLTADVRELSVSVKAHDGQIDALTKATMTLLSAAKSQESRIADLLRLAESHERRLTRLEGP